MEHHFNIDDAKKYGVECAIILNNIKFWISKNEANRKHFYEGRYWTYNSVTDFKELFPYWTENQIRRYLEKLVKEGVLLTGNFNTSLYDKTKWYCLNSQTDLAKLPNGNGENDKPIPYKKPNLKQDSKPDKPKKEKLPIPTFDEFFEYAKLKEPLIDKKELNHKYDAWIENGWCDGFDNEIKNWKSKLSNTLKFISKVTDKHDIPNRGGSRNVRAL